MRLFSVKHLIILLTLIFTSSVIYGTSFHVVAPGEIYTSGGGAKSGTPDSQTAGVPFVLTVYSVDETSSYSVQTSPAQFNMTDDGTVSYVPTTSMLTLSHDLTPSSKQYVTVTASTAVTGALEIYANEATVSGMLPGSVTINVQAISSFSFATVSSITAGDGVEVTVTAIDNTDTTVDGFNGTAVIAVNYSTNPQDYIIQFTDGVYVGHINLYKAEAGIDMDCNSTVPVASGSSSTFSVSPGTTSKIIVIGPGQEYEPGTNTGTGRTGQSTMTTQQTAGTSFPITVYACDNYWNTVTSETGTVNMTTSDGVGAFDSSSKSFSSGQVSFTVDLETVGSGSQTITATRVIGGYTSNDTVPMIHDSFVDKFGVPNLISNKTAGESFQLGVVAYDAYNNTVLSYNSAPTVDVIVGATSISTNNFSYGFDSGSTFSNGIGVYNVSVFQWASNATFKFADGAEGSSNTFSVSEGAYKQLLLISPGESHDPGDTSNTPTYPAAPFTPIYGEEGSPIPITVGAATTFRVIAADDYGNQQFSENSLIVISSTDTGATIDGSALPYYVTLSAGARTFNVIFETAGTRNLTASVISGSIYSGTDSLDIIASNVSYFTISGFATGLTADGTYNPIITARDIYGNQVQDYTGTIYLSSPLADYKLPDETTINVSGTGTSASGHKWQVDFIAGDFGSRSVNLQLRRAMTQTLFVSDAYSDTSVATAVGHVGETASLTVTPGTQVKYQVLVPGIENRPGTVDGESNSPSGQAVGVNFDVVVNIVDQYFNLVNVSRSTDITTSAPGGSEVDDSPTVPFVNALINNGTRTFTVSYNTFSNSFVIEAYKTSGDLALDMSPPVPIYNVDTFSIRKVDGSNFLLNLADTQVAGSSFTVSMTAMASGAILPDFNGYVELSSSSGNENERVVWPQYVSFTSGLCVADVIIYRSSPDEDGGSGQTLIAEFGEGASKKTGSSGSFYVTWSNPTQMIGIVQGTNHVPGTVPALNVTDYGYSGTPERMKAGVGYTFKAMVVDDYYNRVWTESGNIGISCPQSQGFVDGVTMSATVALSQGSYETSLLSLTDVGNLLADRYLVVSHGSYTNFTAPESPGVTVYNADLDHFVVDSPPTAIAGESFNITVTAMDVWSNTVDARFQVGTSYNDTVDFTPYRGGVNTMYPKTANLSNGVAVSNVQLFKSPVNELIIASDSPHGTSFTSTTVVGPNEFSRLYVYTNGMDADGNGIYTDALATVFPINQAFPITRTVNDSPLNKSSDYPFTIFTCDAYGNYVVSADSEGQTVTISTNDPYAPVTENLYVPSGYNSVTKVAIEFHTAMVGVTVGAQITAPGILDFETPGFETTPGNFYGMQVIVPGITVDYGSGTANASSWNNGLAGDEAKQIVTVPFSVTVQAADVYGNWVDGINDSIRLQSNDINESAYPSDNPGGDINMNMLNGILNINVILATEKTVALWVENNSDATKDRSLASGLSTQIDVVSSGNLEYKVSVNGVSILDGGPSENWGLTVSAYAGTPEKFKVQIEMMDIGTGTLIGVTDQPYVLVPCGTGYQSFVDIGGTTINPISSNVVFGPQYVTYNASGLMRLRVERPAQFPGEPSIGRISPTAGWSPILYVGADPFNVEMNLVANPPNIGKEEHSDVTAVLTDVYGSILNSSIAYYDEVLFELISGTGTFDGGVTVTSAPLTNGSAIAIFTGAAINDENVIRATYLGNTGVVQSVSVYSSLSTPKAGTVSNYPNPFKAGTDSTTFEYILPQGTDVVIKIYTLLGDLVYEEEIREGRPGAVAGMTNEWVWDGTNNNGVVVGNGGYICVVEAMIDGELKKMIRKVAVAK